MNLGHALSRASAVVVLVLSVALNARPTTCHDNPGGADYIRAGLGYDGPVQITQITHTEYAYYTTTEHVIIKGTGTTPAPDLGFVAASACSSSWSRYSSRSSKNIVIKYITSTIFVKLSTQLTYGTGDVYTTEPTYNIPVANGNFTATSTGNRVFNVTSTVGMNVEVTLNATLAKTTPKCSLIKPKECSKLYVSYISSLGLPINASVPDVTPVPANSPPCPTYYYKPFSTCTKSFVTSYSNDCTIMGNSVQLFYFPTQTTTASADATASDALATITAPPAVIYEYAPGTTFTSPSIYLKFDYLSAERLSQGNDAVICSICDHLGCRQQAVDGGQERNREGTSIEGQLVSLAPEEVSSIVLNFNEQEASSIISTMAHGLPGYADVMNKVVANFDVVAKRLNLEDVKHPPPEAYYLQPLDNAPGCELFVPQPQCSTIFEGAYRALISLPQEVTGFQGAWKSCFPVIYGVYDPPIALTKASTADGATLPGYRPTAQGPQTTRTPQTAQPANLPQIPPIARPTALPNELPNSYRPAGPTLPNSGGSMNDGGDNGGSSNNNGGSSNNNNGGSSNNNNGGSSNNNNGGSSNNNNGGSSNDNGGGSSNNNGGSSNNNGGSSNNNGGGASNNGGAGSANAEESSGNNGAGSSNNDGGSISNGGGFNNNGGGGTNSNGRGGVSRTGDNDESANSNHGGASETTNGNDGDEDVDGGSGGGSNDSSAGGSSRASGTSGTTGRPSGFQTPSDNSGDDNGSTSDSASSPSLASAALPGAAIPLMVLCVSIVLSTTRLLIP